MFVAIACACALAVLVVAKVVLMVPVWWVELHREDRVAEAERVAAAIDPWTAPNAQPIVSATDLVASAAAIAKAGEVAKDYNDFLADVPEPYPNFPCTADLADPDAARDTPAGWARVASDG